jgi:hypothetical protein
LSPNSPGQPTATRSAHVERRHSHAEGNTKKEERKYEHIKDSYKERGVSNDAAEERAARTVNKERSEEGETKKDKD